MIAPRIVSHVQPSGRDYSGTTSPRLITSVPTPEEARVWVEDQAMRRVVTVAAMKRYYSIGLGSGGTEAMLATITRITEA